MRQALKDGARAKHLEKGRVTFPLEDEAFNETGGQPRQLSHLLLKVIPSKMKEDAVAHRRRRPHVSATAENLRSTNKMPRSPIRQRQFTSRWAEVIGAHITGFDDKDTVVLFPLGKYLAIFSIYGKNMPKPYRNGPGGTKDAAADIAKLMARGQKSQTAATKRKKKSK